VDLDHHQVIDLLPDRQAETATIWIQTHPEITHVSRDRGGEYASAASAGAPQAVQVADRFHIAKNLSEAVQQLLARVLTEIKAASQEAGAEIRASPHLMDAIFKTSFTDQSKNRREEFFATTLTSTLLLHPHTCFRE